MEVGRQSTSRNQRIVQLIRLCHDSQDPVALAQIVVAVVEGTSGPAEVLGLDHFQWSPADTIRCRRVV